MVQPHNTKLSEEHSHINRLCFLSGCVLWDTPWAVASYSCFRNKYMKWKHLPFSNPASVKSCQTLPRRNLQKNFFKNWIFIKFEILLLISFQVLGDIWKHFHMTFQDSDSQRFSSNKNLPQIFSQPICLWDWFYKIIKEFRCQPDPRHPSLVSHTLPSGWKQQQLQRARGKVCGTRATLGILHTTSSSWFEWKTGWFRTSGTEFNYFIDHWKCFHYWKGNKS